jgi:hypothetical protein
MKGQENGFRNAIRRGNVVARGSPSETLRWYIKEHINGAYCLVQPNIFSAYRYGTRLSLYFYSVRIGKGLSLSEEEQEALNTLKTLLLLSKKELKSSLGMKYIHGQKRNRK